MKIALFSDIHANLPALEVVLADIEKQAPDMVFCLGDLVGYAPWPNEVTQAIKKRNIPTIAGNYDEGVGINSDDCGCAYKTEEDKVLGAESIAFTNEVVSDESRTFLRGLPKHLRVEYGTRSNNPLNLLMVHGSPRKINEYLFEDRPDKSFMRMMEREGADVMLFGHTHKPFYKKLGYEKNGEKRIRHSINIGSVGKPKDGDPRACYVLLRLDENLTISDDDFIKVEFRRCRYDVEKTAKAIEKSPLPDAFADKLRKAC